jgi:hypothetical protein
MNLQPTHTVYSFRMLVLATGGSERAGFPLKHLELRLLNGAYSGLQQKGESPCVSSDWQR